MPDLDKLYHKKICLEKTYLKCPMNLPPKLWMLSKPVLVEHELYIQESIEETTATLSTPQPESIELGSPHKLYGRTIKNEIEFYVLNSSQVIPTGSVGKIVSQNG